MPPRCLARRPLNAVRIAAKKTALRFLRWPASLRCVLAGVAVGRVAAASVQKEVNAIYEPLHVEQAALAPDGKHVAFAVRDGRRMEVRIYGVGTPLTKAVVELPARASAQVQFLAWSSSGRVVISLDQPLIASIDARVSLARPLVDAKTFAQADLVGHTLRVLGLADDDTESLLLEKSGFNDAGEVELEVVRLHVADGARQRVYLTQVERPGGSFLIDQQGVPRMLFSRAMLPQRFTYRARATDARWKPLDTLGGDTRSLAFAVTPANYLGERSIPLGFDHDPDLLYFASNVGRDTFGVYALDLRTGRRTSFAVEDPEFDLAELGAPWTGSPLVFDRSRRTLAGVRGTGLEPRTRWLDPEIARLQPVLEKKFPARHVQILEWDAAREHVLALVGGQSDPGRYFVYHARGGQVVEYLARTRSLPPEQTNPSEAFSFAAADGTPVSGYLTVPHAASVAKPPLLLWLHDGPWQRSTPGFNRDAQALAAMGFLVAQIDYAGSAGRGRKTREAIRRDLDGAPLADVLATVAWLEGRHVFDRQRVALAGEGFGGYLALRALELAPERFRCAVAINAPVELGDLRRSLVAEQMNRAVLERELMESVLSPPATPEEREAAMERRSAMAMSRPTPPLDFEHELLQWFYGDSARLAERSVLRHASAITKPVLLLHDPRHRYAPIASAKELRDALARRRQPVALGEISPQFARGTLSARAQVIRRVGEFLNVTLYDFDVKIGEAKETK